MTDGNERIIDGSPLHHSQELGLTMPTKKDDDWKGLIGQYVQVWKDGRHTRTGRVHDVAPALAAIWLETDGVENRAIYEEVEGYSFHASGHRMKTKKPTSITIVADDKTSMETKLEAAVRQLVDLAVGRIDQGILVTRIRHDACRVSLSPSIPYGYTEQQDLRN